MIRSRDEDFGRDEERYERERRERYGVGAPSMDWEGRSRDDDWRMSHGRGRVDRGGRYGRPDFDEDEERQPYFQGGRGGRERWRSDEREQWRPQSARWGRQYGRYGEPESTGTEAWGGSDISGYYGPREGYGMQRGGMGRGDGGEQWRGRTSRRSEGSARWRTSGDLGSGGEMGRFEERESFRGRGPKGFSRSDDRIREDVCDLLEDNPDLDASDVEVKVDSGEVTLTGRVDGRWAKRLAEDITCSVRGVRECHNQLRSSGMKESQQRGGQEMAAGGNGGRRSEQFTAR